MPGDDVVRLAALRRAKDLIDRAYADPLDLRALAREASYSPYHFVRAFAAAYGETPGRYLSRRRVERAQELLRSVNLTVTEVCHLVGFASLGTFTTRFREVVGETPGQYRERCRREVGVPPIPGCFVLMWGGIGTPQSRRSGAAPGAATVGRPDKQEDCT